MQCLNRERERKGRAPQCLTQAPEPRLAAPLMSVSQSEILPPEAQLALAHTRPEFRAALTIFLELDRRLGRIVAGTSEPMLGQMRLAWWRDMLGKPVSDRPTGDAVLDGIGRHWTRREAALVALVDGWEHLLAEPPLAERQARAFAEGRRDGLLGLFGDGPGKEAAAWAWALADLAANVSLEDERAMLVRIGLDRGEGGGAVPRDARGLAVLGALGRRALRQGGRPLMEGRGAALVAARAAMIGR